MEMTWLGTIGAIGGGLAVIPVAIFYGFWALAPIAIGSLLIRLDPGKFPKNCKTLGDLAAKMSKLNVGYFADKGARVSDTQLWEALTEIVSAYSSLRPEAMRRECLLLSSQRKAA
jgi:hypothetical protein